MQLKREDEDNIHSMLEEGQKHQCLHLCTRSNLKQIYGCSSAGNLLLGSPASAKGQGSSKQQLVFIAEET